MQSTARRNFLKKTIQSTASFLAVNAGVYAVGTAFTNLDGSMMAAGVKFWASCTCGILPPNPSSCSKTVAAAQAAYPTLTCYLEYHGGSSDSCGGDAGASDNAVCE